MFFSRMAGATALSSLTLFVRGQQDWTGTPFAAPYGEALHIPPVKQPVMQVTNPVTNQPIDYYEIEIKPFQKEVFPGLGSSSLVGYDGMSPGPTFLIEKGREAVVRFTNKADTDSVVHLHGSYSRAPWDGWAEDKIGPDEYKDYYWPNSQSARLSWYHDHAMDHTAVNAYFGQAGGYIIRDPAEASLGLPSGYGEYEIPLILESKSYNPDGTLIPPGGSASGSSFTNLIHVNGKTWPYFKVEPRKYRFRLLDATLSRTFELFLSEEAGSERIPFQVISSDSGLLTEPVTTSTLSISMAERYDIVVDFAPLAGQNITLRNVAAASTVFAELNNIIRFVVDDEEVEDPSSVPSTLRELPVTPPSDSTVSHEFRFANTNGRWTINEVGFSDPARVLANVPRGTVEVWEFQHLGGPVHPIHVHLVDFRILSRTGGTRSVQAYEQKGLKDVVWLGPGDTIRIEAWYAPWDGLYMFHCHNMLHEDNEMMAAFNVTQLQDLGYPETSFADPMEQRWRAIAFDAQDYDADAIKTKIEAMALLQPYNNIAEVEEVLNDFWDHPEEATRVGDPSIVKARRISRIERSKIAQ
ncbi:hypothetical protein NLU13_2692 [Sarocladium strictum]|uniref:Bilirubin oxidase n=1 Tax=Sarocladium strictum TaxID=5046 RepID=A0AA39L9J6_SARSR|nr:hypothetical protein NLU13_2692 [Sarocladium strictum]